MKLILFDFDGTITDRDSLFDFIQFAVGKPVFYYKLLQAIPFLMAFKIGFISNTVAKQKLLSLYFKGWDSDFFQAQGDRYAIEKIPQIIRPNALKKIQFYLNQGDTVVVVSASISFWLKQWCKQHHLILIATELEIKNHQITGLFASPNCFGQEKVNRIKAQFDLTAYTQIIAYGDSKGDKEMLAFADKGFYRYF